MRILYSIFLVIFSASVVYSQNFVPADDPHIQFYGRWDWSNPSAPAHSWPGVYIYAEFEGTSIGARLNDNFNYFNVFIDGELVNIFHGTTSGTTDYILAPGLSDGQHSLLLTKRNESWWTSFTFYGLILDDGKNLLEPAERPVRKIEFLGDSFTSASGNEATTTEAPSDVEKYTNIYEGFGPIIARNYNAQYHMTSISGIGLVLDYQSNYSGNLPDRFNRINVQNPEPVWDFEQWIPNLVVIGLGLNDYSGFGGWDGDMEQAETDLYKTRYHEFIATIRDVYPGVKILAVATHVGWMRSTIAEVVQEENDSGNNDVYYAQYSYYDGGYVNNGHPNVATHHGIANELIGYIDQIDPWEPYLDTNPPVITSVPDSPFISYDEEFEIKVITDSYSTMKYDFTDKSYDDMEYTFTVTGRRNHSLSFEGEHGTEYTLYLKAADQSGNVTPEASTITFSIDTTKSLLNWTDPGFNDLEWNSGTGFFGQAGSAEANTIIDDVNTVYFRKSVNIYDPSSITAFGVLVKGSDAAAVYLNGSEIGRTNFPDDDDLDYDSYAAQSALLNKMFVITNPSMVGLLRTGENVIAIEMHKSEIGRAGISFDSQMINQNNQVIYTLGSEWYYYDAGNKPEVQLVDKVTGINDKNEEVKDYILYQNYPNPFNPETTIQYSLPESGRVILNIYNIAGEKLQELVNDIQNAGNYSLHFDASDLASGIYFYRLGFHNRYVVKAMLHIK